MRTKLLCSLTPLTLLVAASSTGSGQLGGDLVVPAGKSIEVETTAKIGDCIADPEVATIVVPYLLSLEQFTTQDIEALKGWVAAGHRVVLCNDVAVAFGSEPCRVTHGGEIEWVPKVPADTHPLVKAVARVVGDPGPFYLKPPYRDTIYAPGIAIPPEAQVLIGTTKKVGVILGEDGTRTEAFLAGAMSGAVGEGEVLYLAPWLDFTKFDGPVLKENYERHIKTFPTGAPPPETVPEVSPDEDGVIECPHCGKKMKIK